MGHFVWDHFAGLASPGMGGMGLQPRGREPRRVAIPHPRVACVGRRKPAQSRDPYGLFCASHFRTLGSGRVFNTFFACTHPLRAVITP